MKQHLLLWLLLLCSGSAWAQNLNIRESFEGTTSEYGYTSNTFTTNIATPSTQYFIRASDPVTVNGSQTFGSGGSGQMTGEDGTYFWAAEGVRGTSATTPDPNKPAGYVTLNAIPNAQTYTDIRVKIAAGDPRGSGSTALTTGNDHLRIQYSYGSGGVYRTAGEFARDPAVTGNTKSFWTQIGAINPDGSPAPTATLTPTFTDYTFSIPAGSGDLYIKIEADFSGSQKEIAFDNIRVTGTASTVAKPTIVSTVGNSTLTFAEGSAPLTIFSGLTVGNPAMATNPMLSEASVTISPYAGPEDALTYTIPAGSGIAAPVISTSGTSRIFTFTGTSSVGNYEALLESVKYQDTDANNATAGNRLFSFVVKAGAVTSAPLERTINVTTALNGASLLNYTENFETDGEGTRYASNTRTANSQGFLRLTNASGGSATPGPAFTNGSTTTFTSVQGTGYWYANGTNGVQPTGTPGRITLAPVDSRGFRNLRFKIKAGATSSAGFSTDDYLRFSYSTDGGASFVIFTNYFGASSSSPLYNNGNSANPPLTTNLTDLDIALTSVPADATIIFRIEANNGGGEQIVFDNIQITGTQLTTVNSLVRASPNPTNAATVNYTVTFGAPVTGLTAANFTLTTSGLSGATVGTPVSTGTGSTWTVPVTTGTGSGTLTLNLANDTNLFVDVTTTLPFAGETYTIDKTAPTVSSVSVPANGTYRTGQKLNFTVNFSEAVTVTGTPQLGLTLDTGGSVPASYASGSGSMALVFTYTVVAGNADANGIAVGTLTLNGGTIRDAAANTVTLTLNGVASTTGVLVDGIAPTVSSITRQTPAANPTNSTSLTFRVTFSENVTGVDASDFTLTTTAGSVSSSGKTVTTLLTSSVYDVTVSGVSGNGTVRLDLNGSGIADAAGNAINGGFTGETYTIDQTAPTVTAFTSTNGASGGTTTTTPLSFSVTFSESVTGFSAAGITVTNGSAASTPSGSGAGPYTFTVTPTTAGTPTSVTIAANAARDLANNVNTASGTYLLTYNLPSATVTGISKLAPTAAQSVGGTATATVSFTVTFSAPVSGVSASNFGLNPTVNEASIASVSPATGPSATYTVVVNTGIGTGTLQLNVTNATGISPSVTNTPYSGTSAAYTIVKSFGAAPQLVLRGAGSASGNNSDVTAFVDGVQVLQNGTSNSVANALQNGSFETNNLGAKDYSYPADGLAVPNWTFAANAGVARIGGSGFTPAASGQGSFVAFLQSAGGSSGSTKQNLAVPTGTYQVNFVAAQRANQGVSDQVVNVFLNDGTNDVFLGTTQPTSTTTYVAFTAAAFSVTAPALTATVSTTSGIPTSTSPIPFAVRFSQPVGTSFTASDVTVTGVGGTVTSFSGSGAGPYTFTVTPNGAGTVTVSVAAGVANDANNTQNLASIPVSVQYQLPACVVTARSQNVTVTLGADGTASVAASAVDNGSSSPCGAVTVRVSPSTFTCANLGDNSVTLTVTAPDGTQATASATVTVSAPTLASTTWTGAGSTDWGDCRNWSYGLVPTAAVSALVPGGTPRSPSLPAGTYAVSSLSIASGASLSTTASATLQVSGNFTNDGTTTLAGPVQLVGTTNQTLGGQNALTFSILTLAKPAGTVVQLQRDLPIATSLTLGGGTLATASYSVLLGSSATLRETNESYVLGNVAATRTLAPGAAETFGGLGLTLTPAAGSLAPGLTPVVRTTGTVLTGVGTSQSIKRYFDIQPAVDQGLNVELVFGYFEHELNAIPAANLVVFKSATTAGPWLNQGQSGRTADAATASGTVRVASISSLSIWTLGNAANPLPVTLTSFTAQASSAGASATVRLAWATASEVNSKAFEVERSLDGVAFAKIGEMAAAGTSSQAHIYTLLDAALPAGASLFYYRLRQVDLDGTAHYSPVRSVALCAAGLNLYPNPAHGRTVTLLGAQPGTRVSVLDALGRQVLSAPVTATGTAVLALPLEFAAGVYVVRAGSQALRLTVE